MKTTMPVFLMIRATLFAALALTPCLSLRASDTAPAAVPTREDSVVISMVATVKAVDLATRQLTLADELGKEVALTVGDQVQRLGEIAAGDTISVDFLLSLAFELREPTDKERENPMQIDEGAGRATKDVAPAGGAARVIRAVCVIEGLDRPTMTATLRGPFGGLNVVRVADAANLPKLRIGQSVVVTYTEAVAIAVSKVTP